MTVEKPEPKQLLRPITTGVGSVINQSQIVAITCNSLEAREKSGVHCAIDFGFDSHWLKNWRKSFKQITKRSNRNHVITFDSHLKTALYRSEQRNALMGFLHDTVTWYKIRHAGWQKNAAASKTKRFPPAKRDFPLFWMSQCVACHPAGEISYHLPASCKGPNVIKQTLR